MKITIPKILMGTIGLLALAIMGFTSAFAYTPSRDLTNRLSSATTKLETLISIQGESVREQIISILESYKTSYSGDDRATYIINYLIDSLNNNVEDNTVTGGTTSTVGSSNYLGTYIIDDAIYGTETNVTVSGHTRTIETNALPNHETGEFPRPGNPNTISAQDSSYSFPANGENNGNETRAREPGVAINGVKFEPETAERVSCSSGEEYKIEAIQDFANLGLDDQKAHVQPTGAYHYHGISQGLVDFADNGEDLVHIGFAMDGNNIYYSKSGAYNTSYELSTELRTGTSCTYRDDVIVEGTTPDGTYVSDRVFDANLGDLDACNGIEIDGEYIYMLTDEYPYIGRCLNGEFTQAGPGGAGGPGGQGGGSAGGPPPRR